ncbi:hypothetical protein [Ewingella americana]|uniref:hypothetical protein n=1 Tax=Ewingella americana TaxID=41202 RepID=UPI00163A53D2|nr:hypothetical protein [Ewingella americana]QMV51519.1 hypothetical protein GXP68_09260 [Ewingella americana]
MPVNLDTIPAPYLRPTPPKPLRWLAALVCLVATGILLMRLLGKLVGDATFWWFAMGIPVIFWLVLMGIRMAVYMIHQIKANAWDKRREQVILQEVRRGRRALQILAETFSTAHLANAEFTDCTEAMLRNQQMLTAQTSWKKESTVRHSRLPTSEDHEPQDRIAAAFAELLESFVDTFAFIRPDHPIAVLLESASSIPDAQVKEIWQKAWKKRAFPQPTHFVRGSGLRVIDKWLDNHIQDEDLLLVVAVHIAPDVTLFSAEAVVGLLLGNRLTQKDLLPLALLHRPELSELNDEVLRTTALQAADWVPMSIDRVQHLWLTGISAKSDAYRAILKVKTALPFTGLEQQSDMHHIDSFLGDTALAAPWLAIAVAAKSMSYSPAPHFIFNGEQGSESVWSCAVSPNASHKENIT